MSAVADKLREARALIERGWTQGVSARNKYGAHVSARSEGAVCWCSIGALIKATDRQPYEECTELLAAVVEGSDIVGFNDAEGRTQAEVLAAFDKAITLAEAQS